MFLDPSRMRTKLLFSAIAGSIVVAGVACGSSPEPDDSGTASPPEATAPPPEGTPSPPAGTAAPPDGTQGNGNDDNDAGPVITGGVHGDPAGAIEYWEQQTESDCGLMATRMVVGEITGSPPSEREIIDLATKTPSECSPGEQVYDESVDPSDGGVGHGTCTTDLLLLLKHYGIQADYTNDDKAGKGGLATGMSALAGYLDDGREAIVCVNASTIWAEEDGDGTGCGHLVTVAAIDFDNNAVYLGDSGGDDTRGEHVTVDVFESAWGAGDHELVVTAPR